jgi:RNA polymerase sigma factor (TIGR02999 family)
MNGERPGHTLQTTALVNEAYLRLVDQKRAKFENRAQFFALAATLMRHILVDHARSRRYLKRGGGAQKVSLDHALTVSTDRDEDLVALDTALVRLAAIDARKSKVVELRFFGGLSVEETAQVLDVSAVTVMREWKMAKAWLYNSLSET